MKSKNGSVKKQPAGKDVMQAEKSGARLQANEKQGESSERGGILHGGMVLPMIRIGSSRMCLLVGRGGIGICSCEISVQRTEESKEGEEQTAEKKKLKKTKKTTKKAKKTR